MSEKPAHNKAGGSASRYLMLLFAAAFLMLLLAFFIQQRDVEVAREESDSLSPASVSIGVE